MRAQYELTKRFSAESSIRPFIAADPERTLATLRRSCSKTIRHLGKVHPALLARTCGAWLEEASAERLALVEHALRNAVKRGDATALRLLGYGKKAAVRIEGVRIVPARVAIGGRVVIHFVVTRTSRTKQELLIDLGVHFVKGSGKSARKVFEMKRVVLAAGSKVELSKSISLAVHTTRKPLPGRHLADVIVNGEATPAGHFTVTA